MDATYRKKNNREYQGQSVNIVETANPDNDIQLLTDIAVESNNTDDDEILNNRVDKIKEKTPDLNEMHTDGGYGSKATDEKMEELEVQQVQTDIRGRKHKKIQMHIYETGDDEYKVACPKQTVQAQKTRKRYKANFKEDICKDCEYSTNCPAIKQKDGRAYYFDRRGYMIDKRRRSVESLPPERKKLRPNVEATVKEFKIPLNHKGKLRVRGRFKTMLYACGVGIGVNLGRIHRYLADNPPGGNYFKGIGAVINRIDKMLSGILRFIHKNRSYSYSGVFRTSILKKSF